MPCPHCFTGTCKKHRLQDSGSGQVKISAAEKQATLDRIYDSYVSRTFVMFFFVQFSPNLFFRFVTKQLNKMSKFEMMAEGDNERYQEVSSQLYLLLFFFFLHNIII